MPSQWWVVCLCADWCGVCREYRPVFEALAARHPGVRFEWLDVEDEADLLGDFDAETFPTLLVAHGSAVRFLGPLLPQAGVLERMLENLLGQAGAPMAADAAQAALWMRIQASFPASALPDGRIAE
ncbi:thioredoxin family protein [Xylophilus sp. ASV27]|uniref:thioredoxin family protein n=1 Tax=Xylophilus sp. ASV27 TaxID=2795129 RepID=UPI0018EC18D2|nr:thioredoxin family protein [Xylophilus sp. ASV27]